MTSSVLALETAGRWRLPAVGTLLLLFALPLFPLWNAALAAMGEPLGRSFWQSLQSSLQIGVGSSFIGFLLGLPLGVGSALTLFRGKRLLLVLVSLPLVVPSFLWAIGLANLGGSEIRLGRGLGCLLVGVATTAPLVLFASYAATLEVSGSQLDAALLAGGQRALLRAACRHAALPAALAGAFGGVITLSDPGPGQILGVHTVGAEILATFSTRYELPLAAKQCMVLMLVVAGVAFPLAWLAGPRLARAVFAKQLRTSCSELSRSFRGALLAALVAFLALLVLPPIAGLLRPLMKGGGELLRGALWISPEELTGNHLGLVILGAGPRAAETMLNTILYAGGAGTIATVVAALLALSAGRRASLRAGTLAICLMLFSWPSAASALGVARLASSAPAALDVVLRSRLTVATVLALHFAPVAVVILLRCAGSIPSSWAFAAAVHGVSLPRYARHVLWPAFRPSAALAFTVVALLASADAESVLLLHPPGEASLGLAIVTVMANAPEAFVSALCLIYLLTAAAGLALVLRLARSRAPR